MERAASRQASSSTQRPIGMIRPGLLGERDELVGRDRAARRVRSSAGAPRRRRCSCRRAARPAGSGPRAGRASIALLELGPQLEPLDDPLVHRRLEDAVAALAVALGHVHGDVGVAQQLLGIRGAVSRSREADADAGAREDLLAVDLDRRLERAEDPLGRIGRLLRAGDTVEQDRELVAAEARDGVGRADRDLRAARRPPGARGRRRRGRGCR